MPDLNISWSWMSLVALGSFHGLNPAMGWLFAVALGFQERRSRAVVEAIGPIAIGHAIAVAVVAVVIGLLGAVLPQSLLMLIGGWAMLLFAGYKVATRFRHTTRIGMRVGARELVVWSFLMATAHGAGLMLVPALVRLRASQTPTAIAQTGNHSHAHHTSAYGEGLVVSLLAVGVHTVAMFAVAGAIAVIVYHKVGVELLRRAWINLDLIWIGALALAGGATFGIGLVGVLS